MYYTVKARYIPSEMADFYRELTDGTIQSQRPDGQEIVASMGRARVTEPGVVRWSEQCFCPTPLAHERQTVYDRYFIDVETEVVDGYVAFDGESFMDRLARAERHREG